MTPDAVYWQAPAMVELLFRDGGYEERIFYSRLAAEAFVALIPALQVEGDGDVAGVASAIVRPLGMGMN